MRAFILFLLSSASVLGADNSIQIVSTAKTNAESASVYSMDVFTRDGQTNLVRRTKTKAGVVQIRIHQFYHGGLLVGDFVSMSDSSGFTTEAGTPYSVSFEFDASKTVKSAVIGTKEGVVLDAFSCTNDLFSPVKGSIITKADTVGLEAREVMQALREKRRDK